MRLQPTYLLFLGIVLSGSSSVAAEFQDDLEREFSIRSIGQLQITNLRGGIIIQGWSQDKIRVRARRKVTAPSKDDAKVLFAALDFRYRSVEGDIELSAEYGRGLDIQQRLRERKDPHTSMDMVVMAPANLKLRAWTIGGAVTLKAWSAPLEIRTASGAIHIDNIKSDGVSLLCTTCSMSGKNIRGSVRCMGGAGEIELGDVDGSSIYAESTSGAQRFAHISGEQLYVSKSGSIQGKDLKGHVEFHTREGNVGIEDGAGFTSGRTETGNIKVRMISWKFSDKALIESTKGNIALDLPPSFSGEVDLWSLFGKTHLEFRFEALQDNRTYGPEPISHLRGKIGSGGDQLRIYSQDGNINVGKTL